MKGKGFVFTIGVVLFTLLVFFLTQVGPKTFSWEETYSPRDGEPFGCLLFDSLMCQALPKGYEVSGMSIEELSRTDTLKRRSVLVLNNDYISYDDTERLLDMAARGNKVMIVKENPYTFEDTLGDFTSNAWYFTFRKAQEEVETFGKMKRTTVCLQPEGTYPPCEVSLPALMADYGFNTDELRDLAYVSAYEKDGTSVKVMQLDWEKGSLYFVSTPLLFTNYGVLDEQCRTFVLRTMDNLKDYPVVRLYDFRDDALAANNGPLDFVSRHAPLRFAWQLLVVGVILLLLVNARRRQRALPVLERSVNAAVDFLTQHASLYRKKSDFSPLLRKKYRSFAARLRREWHVEVEDTAVPVRREQAERLAGHLKRDSYSVMHDLQELDMLRHSGAHIDPQLFRHAVKLMDALSPVSYTS